MMTLEQIRERNRKENAAARRLQAAVQRRPFGRAGGQKQLVNALHPAQGFLHLQGGKAGVEVPDDVGIFQLRLNVPGQGCRTGSSSSFSMR